MPRALLTPLLVLLVLLSLVVTLLATMATGSPASAVAADDDPYVCIRSHLILGEDNPICVHVDPGWDRVA